MAACRAEALDLADVRSLQPLRAAGDFELDLITFGSRELARTECETRRAEGCWLAVLWT